LVQRSALAAALPAALRPEPAASRGLRAGKGIYESIGVKPIINCRGTVTVVGGSLELPEVRAAKEAAAQRFVHLDELMEAVGQRLATLTGAPWGIVTSGCAAALTHATAACVAGANPDRHVRLPNLAGFARDEVIIPDHSRNLYDAAVRVVGVRVIGAGTIEEFEAALGPRTAMVYVLAGEDSESGPMSLEALAKLASARKVPVLVDAAAEILTVPNVHLQKGAALVGYSGGKCLRGPQCAGLLLGRKDLVRAAWVHSAPHHGFGRAMKVGKEEVIGMLAAVEAWTRRDHKAEWARWLSWMEQIARLVGAVEGVTATVRGEPRGLSNRSPRLNISWDPNRLRITGGELARALMASEPRIALEESGWGGGGGGGGGRRRRGGQGGAGDGGAAASSTGVAIMAYTMEPGEAKVVGERIRALLVAAAKAAPRPAPRPPAADLGGDWEVDIEYIGSRSRHRFFIRQQGAELGGTHQGDFVGRPLFGSVDGSAVRLASFHRDESENLRYAFTGTIEGDRMSGELDLGEYLGARWSAQRRAR
jgi:D-glucosaminate-6-phosphate ammonia-lyase